ncbi:MAG: hypothetical protein Q8L55_09990 [Phycisphaerales bacterium]|nr:hypothetical protein [Phycisphaerales bacterium]
MSTNTAVRSAAMLCTLLAVAAGGRAALGQIEVVFADSFHSPGDQKSFVPGNPDGTNLTFKNFQRPFRSTNGLGRAMTPTVNGPCTAQDQLVLVGSGLSGADGGARRRDVHGGDRHVRVGDAADLAPDSTG